MRRIATYISARDPIMEASASLWTQREATLLSAALMLISTRHNNAELLALSPPSRYDFSCSL